VKDTPARSEKETGGSAASGTPKQAQESSARYQNSSDEPTPEDRQATQNLSQAWPRILALVRDENPQANGLLNSAKSRYIHGSELCLSFASELLKDKMERDENLQAVYRALKQVVGHSLRIRCKVDAIERNELPSDVDNNGIVATALRELGGEIVDIQ
jgi:hypothetical protein